MSTYDDGGPSTGQSLHGGPSVRTQIIWGGSGFLLGVIVWHFVGFWTFISTIVFHGPDIVFHGPDPALSPNPPLLAASGPSGKTAAPAAIQRERTPSIPAKRSETVLGMAPARDTTEPAASDCTALVLDRAAGTTTHAGCAAGDPTHRVVENTRRGDRAILPDRRNAGWSVVVDAGSDSAVHDVSSGKLEAVLDSRLATQSVHLD